MKKCSKKVAHKSIISQLVIRCVLVITCTVLFTWLVDIFFVEIYYERSQVSILHDLRDVMEDCYTGAKENETEFFETLDRITAMYGMDYVILSGDETKTEVLRSKVDEDLEFLTGQICAQIEKGETRKIEENPEYLISITEVKDQKDKYISMVGLLPDGSRFVMLRALDGVTDSMVTFRVFLFWSIFVNIILASIPIVIFARGISKPIKRLGDISQKMADLDFTAKYESKNKNEVDALGENLNQLSEKLEDTICKLQGANAQLAEDMEQQAKADIVRKEFIANVSHELKTPIALISGYAEGLKESINDDDESRDFYCDVIMDEASKMNRMVRELINLSYFESGGYFPEYSHFNINEMLRNSINSKDILVKNKNAKVVTRLVCEKPDMYVWADEYLIEEVFSNYFTNALNHVSDNGEIVVKTSMDGTNVRVSVHNTGKNIPEDAVDSVWDKFYKVDKARSREYGGSGIGLSIVKAVMEAHKGDYGVCNTKNGVEFWFSLLSKCDIELEQQAK